MSDQGFISIKEAAAEVSVHEDTVRDWLRTGALKGYKLGGLWKIKREDFDAFIAAGSNQPADGVAA